MSEVVKIGFVGCGGIGNHHLKIWDKYDNCKITATCDIQADRAEKAAADRGAVAYTSLEEMLEKADIDAVDICTPSGLHAQQAILAMEAGKHALVEKPIDIDLEKIDRLIETEDRTGLKLCCIFQHRFSPEIQKAWQLIQDGKLGRLISASTYIKWYRGQDYYDADDWRGTYALDGGVFANQGIHSLDQLTWLAGPAAEVEFARMETIDRQIEAETFGIAMVRFENGARGVVEATTNCYPGLGMKTELFGTKGSAAFDGSRVIEFKVMGEEIDLAPSEEPSADETDARTDPMALQLGGHDYQMQDFIRAILEDRPVSVPARSARVGVDLLNKIYRAAGYKGKIGT